MVKVREDLSGRRFGKLKVIEQAEDIIESNGRHRAAWLCKCECGKQKIVVTKSLKNKETRSCGCFAREMLSITHKKYNTYDLSGEYGIGYTSNTNKAFYFDLEDYDKIKDYCWRENKQGYLVAYNNNHKEIIMHRLIMDCYSENQIDHQKHNKLDNRKEMLRIVTNQQNSLNSPVQINNKSSVTGVHFEKNTRKWYTYISYKNKRIFLGRYDSFNDAVKIRKEAEEKYFGKYSYDNSIGDKL